MKKTKTSAIYDIFLRNPQISTYFGTMVDKYGIKDYALSTQISWNKNPIEIYPAKNLPPEKPLSVVFDSFEELVLNQYLKLENDLMKSSIADFEHIDIQDERNLIRENKPGGDDINEGLSYLYLVKEETPVRSFRIFRGFIEVGLNGLCISNMNPDTVKDSYGLEKDNIIWLCQKDGENNINPTDLSKLVTKIKYFISDNGNSVILLDGLEYLIAHNGLSKVLRILDELNNQINKESMFILPIHPDALRKTDLDLLERGIVLLSPQ
jgi:hypothetical protein